MRGVFFDAGDVLYRRASSSTEHARRLIEERGYRSAALNGPAVKDLRRDASLGRIPPAEYWRHVLAACGVAGADQSSMLTEIDRFADVVEGEPDAARVLSEMRRRGKVIGVITDTMYPLERKMLWLQRAGVADLIDVVSCSTALGFRKPDPAIYRDALARAGVSARDAAFVGHDGAEIEGARAVGMTTIAIHPDDHVTADHRVDALADLLDLAILVRA